MASELVGDGPHIQMRLFKTALPSFASSSDNFRILTSIPKQSHTVPASLSTLYVLDSSFNPPTRAHLRIASTALTQDRGEAPKRLLLLLATQNADKAPKPASFDQRLAMMSIFAEDLRRGLAQSSEAAQIYNGEEGGYPAVDIAVTKCPYFVDKAAAIAKSGFYSANTTQVHLTGFDTLIRILDAKYYPAEKGLTPLEPFLSKHRLRVTYRTDADWGDKHAQDQYLQDLKDGERVKEGGKREWAEQIEMVDGTARHDVIISSTKVRDAAKTGDEEALGKLVTDGVKQWVLQEKLYA